MKLSIASEQVGFIAFSVWFVALSIVCIGWPEVIAAWVKSSRPNPTEADSRLMMPIVRFVGLGV